LKDHFLGPLLNVFSSEVSADLIAFTFDIDTFVTGFGLPVSTFDLFLGVSVFLILVLFVRIRDGVFKAHKVLSVFDSCKENTYIFSRL
jgi:hypothetical protein